MREWQRVEIKVLIQKEIIMGKAKFSNPTFPVVDLHRIITLCPGDDIN